MFVGFDSTQMDTGTYVSTLTGTHVFNPFTIKRIYFHIINSPENNGIFSNRNVSTIGSVDLSSYNSNGYILYEPNEKERLIFAKPWTTSEFQIRMTDYEGNVIDLNNQPITMTIILTRLND